MRQPNEYETALAPASRPEARPRRSPAPELDHRIANSLQLAVDFLLFQQVRVADPSARTALIDAAERLVAVSHLHRFLAAHEGETEVDLKPFLESLAVLVGSSTGLTCETEVEPYRVTATNAQAIGLLVNELAINAAKHAYPHGEPGDLKIQAYEDGQGLTLVVEDHGRGLASGPARSEGLGMDIVRRLSRQLNGRLWAETDRGARFTLVIPRQGPEAPRSFAPRD